MFGLDLRSLAALRIGLALVALCDLVVRARDLSVHYTDYGTLARHDVLAWFDGRHELAVSLHLYGGNAASQLVLFAVHAAALLAMLAGWHTRIATGVCWLLALSLHLRNPFLVYGADVLMRLLMLWGILLPLGARWSLDAAAAAQPREEKRCMSIAAIGLQLQVALVLFIAGAAKLATPFWLRGEGLATALDHEFHTRPLGHWLQRQPSLVRLLSHGVLALEAGGALAMFAPWWRIRVAVLVALWAMLAGIFVTMRVGFFPAATAVALLPLVPGAFWDRLEQRLRGSTRLSMLRERWQAAVVPRLRRTQARGVDGAGGARSIAGGAARVAGEIFAAWLIVYTAAWNIGFWYDRDYEPPRGLAELGSVLFLWQQWGMFTDIAATGWFVIPGDLADGTTIDLLANGGRLPSLEQARARPLTYEKPQRIADRLPNIHWQAMFATMMLVPDEAGPFQYYARYLCREWNRTHSGGQSLRSLRILHMTRPTQAQPADHPASEYERRVLWTHDCFG